MLYSLTTDVIELSTSAKLSFSISDFLFYANQAVADVSQVVISKISVVLMRYSLFFFRNGRNTVSSYYLRRMKVVVGVRSLFAPYL